MSYLLITKNGGGILLYQNRNGKIFINYLLSTSRALNYTGYNLQSTIYHKLTTNSFLFKIGKNDINLCNLCKIEEETIYHLLWQCPIVQDLINNFFNFCNTRGITVPRDPCTFFLELISIQIVKIYSQFFLF